MERSPLTVSLHAPDVAAAVRFYTEKLGFEDTGRWAEGDAPIWAEVSRPGPLGTARIWFFSNPIDNRRGPMLSGVVYLFVADVDAEARRLRDAGVKIHWGPEEMPYGLREVGFEDLNGYLLCFAQDV